MLLGFITESGTRYSMIKKDGKLYIQGGKCLPRYCELAPKAPRLIVGLPAEVTLIDGSVLKTSPIQKYLKI